MPTLDDPPAPHVDPVLERVIAQTRTAVGASDRMPVRVMVLFLAIVVCAAMAPIPFNLVGVSALAMLALDTAIHRR